MAGTENKVIQIATPFIGEEEWQAVREPLESGWLTQGPKVARFEEEFCRYHGVKHGIAVTSCTTALHLALAVLELQPNDAVFLPSFTWIATANAVEYCGARPFLCDVQETTNNLDPQSLREQILSAVRLGYRPRAVIAVHLFGLCADMDAVQRIADEYGMRVIEDAACAAGAQYKGRFAGALGDIACFSFHPRKVVTTGEGGMCTTQDDRLAEAMRCLRNHGASLSEEMRHVSSKPYLMPDFEVLGFNYRMTDIQGAIGVVQLTRLKAMVEERKRWATYYDNELKDISWLKLPAQAEGHSYQSYVCRVDEPRIGKTRNAVMEELLQNGIHSRAGTHAVHELGYYRRKYAIDSGAYPIAQKLYATTLALPLHNTMNADDYRRVVRTIREM